MQKQMLRIDEAASYLKVSKRTVYRLISSGQVEAFKVGHSLRVRKEAIREFISRQIENFQYENGFRDQA